MPVATCILNCVCMYGIYLFSNDAHLSRFYEDDDEDSLNEINVDRDQTRQPAIAPTVAQDAVTYCTDTKTLDFSWEFTISLAEFGMV